MMFMSFKEIATIICAVFLSCLGATFCLCFTYWFVKLTNKMYYIDRLTPSKDSPTVESDNTSEKKEVKATYDKPRPKVKKIEPTVSDDLPFSAPMKVESNFGDGQLGKTKE